MQHLFPDSFLGGGKKKEDIQGNQSKDVSSPENVETVQASFGCFISILIQVLLGASDLSSPEHIYIHVASVFTNEEQKMLHHIWYFCHTFQPCLWCHWHGLQGTNWKHSWSFCSNFQKTGQEIQRKAGVLCIFKISYSIPMGNAHCASSLQFCFKRSTWIQKHLGRIEHPPLWHWPCRLCDVNMCLSELLIVQYDTKVCLRMR